MEEHGIGKVYHLYIYYINRRDSELSNKNGCIMTHLATIYLDTHDSCNWIDLFFNLDIFFSSLNETKK